MVYRKISLAVLSAYKWKEKGEQITFVLLGSILCGIEVKFYNLRGQFLKFSRFIYIK